MSGAAQVALLPGDGIGPEVIAATLELCEALCPGSYEFEPQLFGGASIDLNGVAMTDETLAACRAADAVLLGAVGGPKWDTRHCSTPARCAKSGSPEPTFWLCAN